MNTNELLFPRYKVTALWPGMEAEPFRLEQMVTLRPHKDDEGECFIHIPDKHIPGSYMRQGFFDKYPHLFKKLEWWEERAIEDMPEYLNCPSRKMFFKVESWHKSYFIIDGRQKMQYRNYIPATLAEYEDYINQKEKQ